MRRPGAVGLRRAVRGRCPDVRRRSGRQLLSTRHQLRCVSPLVSMAALPVAQRFHSRQATSRRGPFGNCVRLGTRASAQTYLASDEGSQSDDAETGNGAQPTPAAVMRCWWRGLLRRQPVCGGGHRPLRPAGRSRDPGDSFIIAPNPVAVVQFVECWAATAAARRLRVCKPLNTVVNAAWVVDPGSTTAYLEYYCGLWSEGCLAAAHARDWRPTARSVSAHPCAALQAGAARS